MKSFKELGLKPELLKALDDLGFENPTPIQGLSIPQLEDSEDDLIAYAQTGTGKTAAFSLPILNKIDTSKKGIKAFILSPTRELCIQITRDIEKYAKHLKDFKVTAVYGGANIENQLRQLKSNCDIVVGTPGRTLDLINRKSLHLDTIQFVVLDEADEMLSMGFAEDLDAILGTTPEEKQTLCFSATMPPEMKRLTKKYMKNPIEISAGSKQEASTKVHHVYYQIGHRDRYAALKRAVDIAPDIYGIIFCRTRADTKEVAERLAEDGYNTDALHGDLSQAQRDYVMNRFRNRQIQLLIATDVAARGLDVKELTHVINHRLPDEDEVYVHRSGRTGRAEAEGVSIVLVTNKEKSRIRHLEKKIGRKFDQWQIPNGKEICEKQLFHLMDNIINTEIISTQIDRFLPQVEEMLEGMSKEEIIRKVVSVEFNRFLDYYRNAPDLNANAGKGSDRDRGDRRDRGERRGRSTDSNMVRYFINQGNKDGLNPKELMGFINRHLGEKSPEIGQIEIMKMFSFFEMEKGHTDELKAAIKDAKFNGRPVAIDESKERPSGGDRDRGGDRNRRRNRSGGDRRDRGGARNHRGGGGRRDGGGAGSRRRRR